MNKNLFSRCARLMAVFMVLSFLVVNAILRGGAVSVLAQQPSGLPNASNGNNGNGGNPKDPSPSVPDSPSDNPGQGHTQVIVCHANPEAGPPVFKYDTIVIDDDGSSGNINYMGHDHHDRDIINPVSGACPTIESSGDPIPSGDPDPSTDPSPSIEPSPSGSVDDVCANIDGIQTSVPDGYHIDASGRNCVQFQYGGPNNGGGNNGGGQVLGASTSVYDPGQGKVLGASTMAKTGVFEDTLMNLILTTGIATSGFGITRYAKSKKEN